MGLFGFGGFGGWGVKWPTHVMQYKLRLKEDCSNQTCNNGVGIECCKNAQTNFMSVLLVSEKNSFRSEKKKENVGPMLKQPGLKSSVLHICHGREVTGSHGCYVT